MIFPSELETKYLPIRRLGRGGYGNVYLAKERLLDRPVALKILSEQFRDTEILGRFQREARVTSQFKHPNIVGVFDFGRLQNGSGFIAYEYVDGKDLAELLARGRPVTPARIASWAVSLGQALQIAHDAGIVHRDLKPANLLIRRDGTPVLCDFGVARVAGGRTVKTQEGVILGTPAYVAPEVWRGAPPTPATDQFALAASLFEALYRARALPGSNPAEIWAALRDGWRARAPKRERRKYPELEGHLLRALSVAPGDRFPSMQAFAAAFESADITPNRPTLSSLPTGPITRPSAVMSADSLVVAPTRRTRRITRTGRIRTRLPPALAGSLIAAVLVGSVLLYQPKPPPPPSPVPASNQQPDATDRVREALERLPTRDPLPPWRVGTWVSAAANRFTDPRFELTLRRLLRAIRGWFRALDTAQASGNGWSSHAAALDDLVLGKTGRLFEDLGSLETIAERVAVGNNPRSGELHARVISQRRILLRIASEHRAELQSRYGGTPPDAVRLHLGALTLYLTPEDRVQNLALASNLIGSLGRERSGAFFPARARLALRATHRALQWRADCTTRRVLLPQLQVALIPLPPEAFTAEEALGIVAQAGQHEVVLTAKCWDSQEPGELGRLDRFLVEVERRAAPLPAHAPSAARMLLDPFFGLAASPSRAPQVRARIARIRAIATGS